MTSDLIVTLIKPSKYDHEGFVDRFRLGYMPNTTPWHIASMTPKSLGNGNVRVNVRVADEMVEDNLSYLRFERSPGTQHLVALCGVQSHQFQRACDIASSAVDQGALAIIGGPHAMTCDTSEFHGSGVSFSLAEAELVWQQILLDAALERELQPVYGTDKRWQEDLDSHVLQPPPKEHYKRYPVPLMGIYPQRGCPYDCNFCSVVQISGHAVRGQKIETVMESLRLAKKAGVKFIIFTSDNFNKYDKVAELLDVMIEEGNNLPFWTQCDTMISEQEWLVEKMARAGCRFIFVGMESFNRKTLLKARKGHNHPERYAKIIKLCRTHGISPHFSNIIGFPDDTEDSVRDHVRLLKELNPTISWFYIYTPLPGTEMYEDYLRDDLITELNLDRFDTTWPTWKHPNFSNKQWLDLLFESYREFYSAGDMASRMAKDLLSGVPLSTSTYMLLYQFMVRWSVRQRVHPMIGGVRKFTLDHAGDFRHLRRKYFGHDLLPLPKRLRPSDTELAANRQLAKSTLLRVLQ